MVFLLTVLDSSPGSLFTLVNLPKMFLISAKKNINSLDSSNAIYLDRKQILCLGVFVQVVKGQAIMPEDAEHNAGMRFAIHICGCLESHAHICRGLESMGLVLHHAPTASAARPMLAKYLYDLVLIHFDTAGPDTLEICSSVRRSNPNAIVMVLMDRPRIAVEKQLFKCGVSDVVAGLQCDDTVLIERIKARLSTARSRRSRADVVRLNGTTVDFARREVWRKGTIHRLPGILADLLRYFVDNADHAVSRRELQRSSIWADSICTPADEGGNTFDVNVGKLRKIIEADPSHPEIIKSVRGVGWKLESGLLERGE